MGVIQYILDLGASVMLPIIILLLGAAFGLGWGRSFRAGLTIGVGFVGIGLVINLLVENLGPAAKAMVDRFGVQLDVVDVGWPAAASIAFASQVGAFVIPIGLGVNILMLLTRTTQTLNVDLWNYWHFAFTGALVAAATGSLPLGLIAAAINAAIVLKLGDWSARSVQEFYDAPGISLPHGFSAAYVPIAVPLNALLDRIPGIRSVVISPESIQRRLGVIGDPLVQGLVLGIALGLLAGYNAQKTLQLGITMAAVMLLMPRMVRLLMEGLMPVSEAARQFMQRRFAHRMVYIGLDSAIAVGHPAAIATSLILVPIAIGLAVIIPGNHVLPFGDLATIPFMVAMVIPVVRGNVFRSVIIGSVVLAVGLLIATNVAPLHTEAAIASGFQMPEGATLISSICDGANPLTWVLLKLMQLVS
ncbi:MULTISPECIES: PTS galactitol transporter subunit IIC [Thermaerobacter]|uniref:Galactitol-specific PTS transporter subunit IIC n=1 Tax=Thermaerobacter composti TaxID=554949 RepID=A0ABZ0QM40_9FIRM|nr:MULTISPECIES: galactitol-specific PTS transporter subunit IIC [Thermaerobacter]QBS36621.1 PTS galactitol transporter subunit IIC [Thermaerobacter sp. FW80]WPD18554.1 galactitol-specific PTS transporter subunit IIC [Thermaerobacter composti]